MNIDSFHWGPLNDDEYTKSIILKEVFQNRIYEKYREVKSGDIVLDIGANVGSFTYSILPKNPQRVYCVEPSNTLIETLRRNVECDKVTFIEKAIADVECDNIPEDGYGCIRGTYDTDTFKNIIQKNGIHKIDFMKIDCEGGEYSVFTEENKDYLLNSVAHIAGEWHLSGNADFVAEFKKFRDIYLKEHKNYSIYDCRNIDVSTWVESDGYLEWYNKEATTGAQFIIYMTNEI